MGGEDRSQGNSSAVAAWDRLRTPSQDPGPGYTVGDSDQRTRFVNGLRELADFLQSRPEVPVPEAGETITVLAEGTTAEKFAQVDYAGRLLDVPVADDTARGGHLYAERNFGPVTYGFVATGVEAAFTVGQDVRLAEDRSIETENAGLALAGTVTGLLQETDGTYSYTVHFPGYHGTQEGMTEDQLEEVDSPAVRLRDGSTLSIKDAEEFLVDVMSRAQRGSEDSGEEDKTGQVLTGLTRACEIGPADLLRQLRPQIDQREQELRAGPGASPAALAARDLAVGQVPLRAPEPSRAAAPSASAPSASVPRPSRPRP